MYQSYCWKQKMAFQQAGCTFLRSHWDAENIGSDTFLYKVWMRKNRMSGILVSQSCLSIPETWAVFRFTRTNSHFCSKRFSIATWTVSLLQVETQRMKIPFRLKFDVDITPAVSLANPGQHEILSLRLVYTYDASTSMSISASISHVWTGMTQAQSQEKGTRALCLCLRRPGSHVAYACACVVRVNQSYVILVMTVKALARKTNTRSFALIVVLLLM